MRLPPPVERLERRMRALLFEGEMPEGPAPLRGAACVFRALTLAGLRFDRDRGIDQAASLAYSSLLALVPAVLLAVSALEFLAVQQKSDVTDKLLDLIFPGDASSLREGFREYFEESRDVLTDTSATGTGVRIFSVGLLLYFAGNLLTAVDRMVGSVWGTGGFRAFVRRLSAYWTVLTLGPLLLAASFAATAVASEYIGQRAGSFLVAVLPFLVTWTAVFLFFRLMPHTRVTTMAALSGAVVTGTLWEFSKLAMGWYLDRPRTLLTTLSFFPAAMLWMYVSWVFAIFGLEVAYIVQHGNWKPGRRAGRARLEGVSRDLLLLALAVEVAREFDEGLFPDRAELARRVGVPEDDVTKGLLALILGNVLVTHEGGGFRPARGTGGIRALDVVEASRGGLSAERVRGTTPSVRVAHEFLRQLHDQGALGLADVSLEDLARTAMERTPPSD